MVATVDKLRTKRLAISFPVFGPSCGLHCLQLDRGLQFSTESFILRILFDSKVFYYLTNASLTAVTKESVGICTSSLADAGVVVQTSELSWSVN